MALKQKMNDQKRVEFAKQVESLYEAAHVSWRRILTLTFLKGLATGVGVFLGGTIVVGLLLWILSGLGEVPFIGDVADNAKQTIDEGTN